MKLYVLLWSFNSLIPTFTFKLQLFHVLALCILLHFPVKCWQCIQPTPYLTFWYSKYVSTRSFQQLSFVTYDWFILHRRFSSADAVTGEIISSQGRRKSPAWYILFILLFRRSFYLSSAFSVPFSLHLLHYKTRGFIWSLPLLWCEILFCIFHELTCWKRKWWWLKVKKIFSSFLLCLKVLLGFYVCRLSAKFHEMILLILLLS